MNVASHFKCPRCGCNRFEEVMVGVIVRSVVTQVWVDDGEDDDDAGELPVGADYGDCSHDGGETVGFACAECGEELPCKNETELYRFLKSMKEENDG